MPGASPAPAPAAVRPLKGRARACPSHPPPSFDHGRGGDGGYESHDRRREYHVSGALLRLWTRGEGLSPHCCRSHSQHCPAADERLPALAFLLQRALPPVHSGWVPWASSLGTAHRPRSSVFAASAGTIPRVVGFAAGPRRLEGGSAAAQAAARAYDSAVDLAAAWRPTRVLDLAEEQSRVQAAPVGFPRNSSGTAANHRPLRHRRHTLLHLFEQRSSSAPPASPA